VTDEGTRASRPIDVLVVASWFPAYDDIGSGRFVADQTEAIAATGAARPAVISFDGARLSGGARSRTRQAETVLANSIAALRTAQPIFIAPAPGLDPAVPVARLSTADGQTRTAGAEHAVFQRESVLRALAERLAIERSQGQESAGTAPARGVVHAHTVYPDGAAAVALAQRLGWPLVITEHSSFVEKIIGVPVLRDRYEGALASAHAVLAVSEMLAQELRTAFPAQAARIAVVPNAVPVELFRSRPLEERVEDELLFVGYRKATKGIENILRAVALAHERRPAITLRLMGRSPDEATEERWKGLAGDLGIADVVTFEPSVDRVGIAAAMARADLFVHPSPRETFGVVAVEALAAGLPVVATDSGGVSEILGPHPDDVGALVAIDDPEALAEAIVQTLERRAMFDPVALRASVERRFGAAFVAERLLVVYREALGPQVGPDAPTEAVSVAAGTPPPGRTVVVALDRTRAALRLGPLPDELRARIDLVTSTEPSEVSLPRVRSVAEVDIDTDWQPPIPAGRPPRRGLAGRLERLARDPIGTVLRRLGRGAGSEPSLRPATRAIQRLLADAGEPVQLLPLDGHDHLAVAPLVDKGTAHLSSGGLRWLADRWHASGGGRPEPDPGGSGSSE
jgi:glycosyltransferase involved in cell wall biosynthesis